MVLIDDAHHKVSPSKTCNFCPIQYNLHCFLKPKVVQVLTKSYEF